jgi:hypothetical protein
MPAWVSKYLSMDDLWSVVGYGLLLSVNQLVAAPMPLPTISLLASGMLAIIWVASRQIRERNRDRNPNVRVVIWMIVAILSALVGLR